MPQHQSAIKRVRQNEKLRAHNRKRRSTLRTFEKNVLSSTVKGEAEKHLVKAVSQFDRMAAKGIIHPNNAARKKARLTKYVNSLA